MLSDATLSVYTLLLTGEIKCGAKYSKLLALPVNNITVLVDWVISGYGTNKMRSVDTDCVHGGLHPRVPIVFTLVYTDCVHTGLYSRIPIVYTLVYTRGY